VRPYWSSGIGMQLTGRPAMNASRPFAAFAPQLYCRLPARQMIFDGIGASSQTDAHSSISFLTTGSSACSASFRYIAA
jgi:hypothetical protein